MQLGCYGQHHRKDQSGSGIIRDDVCVTAGNQKDAGNNTDRSEHTAPMNNVMRQNLRHAGVFNSRRNAESRGNNDQYPKINRFAGFFQRNGFGQ